MTLTSDNSAPSSVSIEDGPHDRGATCSTGAAFGVAQIDEPVLGELRVQHDVAQAALAAVVDVWHAGDLRGFLSLLRDDEEIPLHLRHEHAAIGQECQCPGLVERSDRFYFERQIRLRMRNGSHQTGRESLPAVVSSSEGSLLRRYRLPAGYIAEKGKVTHDSPAGAAFGPKRLSANTKWSSPTSTTLLQRVP